MEDLKAITRMEKIIAGENIKPETRLEIFLKEYSSGGGGGESYKYVTGTLTAGSTSITLSDASITTDATYDIYTTVYGVNPTDVSLVAGSITMTFDVQQSDIGVKIRIYDPVPANVVSISATFEQSGTVSTDTPLYSLKEDLTVTATYDNGVTIPVTDYELSGTLETGTSTITVTYEEKTDTFDVTVSAPVFGNLHEWDFTESLTDSVGGYVARLDNATLVEGTGVKNDTGNEWGKIIIFPSKDYIFEGKTVEIDVKSLVMLDDGNRDHMLLLVSHLTGDYGANVSAFYPDPNWTASLRNQKQSNTKTSSETTFTDCTMKFIFTPNHMVVMVDDETIYEGGTIMDGYSNLQICNHWGDFIIEGLRIYENV